MWSVCVCGSVVKKVSAKTGTSKTQLRYVTHDHIICGPATLNIDASARYPPVSEGA